MRFYDMNDIFYIFKAAVVMHNIMVKEQIGCNEIKSEDNYIKIDLERENDLNPHKRYIHENQVHDNAIRATVTRTEYSFKYEFAARKWNDLYHIGNAIKLQDALKKHLHKTRYEDKGLIEYEAITDDFDPLHY